MQFAELPEYIKALESNSMSMEEQLSIMNSIRSMRKDGLLERFDQILAKNPDFHRLHEL